MCLIKAALGAAGGVTYDASSEPSLGKSILDSFKIFGRRFTFGSDMGRDQPVSYTECGDPFDAGDMV